MPDIHGGMAHYDLKNHDDLAVLIDRGLIWKGGPQAIKLAMDAIISGAVPRPTHNVPPAVNAELDRLGVPVSSDGSDVPPAEPSPLDPESPAEDQSEPGTEPGA